MSRILLVDDHALVRDGLCAMVEWAGHEVVGEADSVTSALAGILAKSPDVVLLDLGLGDRSGLELLVELRRHKVSPAIIVITMSRRPTDVAEALRLGARGYVYKGSRRAELVAAINAAAAGGRYLPPAEAALAAEGLAALQDSSLELSPRERQILILAARGRTSAMIGGALNLSPKTVDTYRNRAMKKLRLADFSAVARWAIREGHMAVDEI